MGAEMTPFGLDHVGIAVRDLDAAAIAYRRLGFNLTPRGTHTLPPPVPGAARPRVGTGNHCIMLGRGYVELIGVIDPGYKGRLRAVLDRQEGAHLVAFDVPDAKAAAADLAARGLPVDPPHPLERPVEDIDGPGLARFELVDFPAGVLPEGQFFAIQHLTPDLLWKPPLMLQPNGVESLEAVTVAVPDPAEFERRLAHVLDLHPTSRGVLALRAGHVYVVPGSGAPPLVGLTLGTADLDQTAEYLAANQVPMERHGTRLRVPASAACGAWLDFVAIE